MNCRNCGAPLDPGARFCRKCGTDVPPEPAIVPRQPILTRIRQTAARLVQNKRMLAVAIGVAALLLVTVLIICIASCAPKKLHSPDEVASAVLTALERGDGDRLCEMASLSEEVCGAHPELFGEGKNAHAVMQGYYQRLADGAYSKWSEAYGKRFSLDADLETELMEIQLYSGTSLFELNRALGIDATRYAVLSGPLYINGNVVGSISLTAVEWDGQWRLLVVYLT